MAAETRLVPGTNPTLDQKLQFLLRPEAYPDKPMHVDSVETHMSWVCLTDSYAYKLKKPVRCAFLNFSTVEARRWDSVEEIRLNSRLAPHIYQGIVPLTIDTNATLKIGGEGEAVDWLVKMRRLPVEHMLDHAIKRGDVKTADVNRAAFLLANFYQTALPIELDESAYKERFVENVAANLRELIDSKYRLPGALLRQIIAAQIAFLQEESELIYQRVQEGNIVEGHGDLRPEHICLWPEPVVIDCLEFKRDYRILDIADELSFLAMECERMGAPSVGETFLQAYSEVTGDIPHEKLLHFYKSYRATLRAKITIWHLNDSPIHDQAKWFSLAMDYLHLADDHAKALKTPVFATIRQRPVSMDTLNG